MAFWQTSRGLRGSKSMRTPMKRRRLVIESLESRSLLSLDPIGNPFLVEERAGDADVAMDDQGNYVVVYSAHGEGSVDIFGQRYSADGSRLGSPFQVNEIGTGRQQDVEIAMDADGDFVVVWTTLYEEYGQY